MHLAATPSPAHEPGPDPDLQRAIGEAQALVEQDALITTLQTFVRIPSVRDPHQPHGSERDMADAVCALLEAWGMEFIRWDVAPDRPNIVVNLIGAHGAGPTLILEGHMDVVTAGARSAWSFDPFAGDIVDGRLRGRGACDMKGGLTAMLYAARALHAAGNPFAGTLRLAILADEEGLMRGAKAFVAAGYVADADAAIICEPEGDRVCIAQKGAIRLHATFSGRMSHGCMPDEGANPVAALGRAIVGCLELEQQVLSRHAVHPLLGRFSLTPTVAIAGEREQGNVLSARAELLLDVRTAPEHDHDELVDEVTLVLQRAAATVADVTVAVETVDDRPATDTAPDAAIVLAACAAHRAETGVDPDIGGVPGSTDGTIFWAATGLPLVTWGPGETTLPHQADESVNVAEVQRYARMYVGAAIRFLHVQRDNATPASGHEG